MKIKSIGDVFKRRSSELEKKKTFQRLVPGITWQIYNKNLVSIDFGFQVGYRVSPRFTAGLGYVHRWGFSNSYNNFVADLQTHGGRVYSDLALVKGLFVHGELEVMKIGLVQQQPVSLEMNKQSAVGSYFGLGKRFKLSRHLRANVQGLYRVNYRAELPDMHKVNVRFGVEYTFRKRQLKLGSPAKE